MRNRFFLWVVSALLLVAGCTNDEIVNEQPTPEVEGSTLVIIASMPDESPQTRVNLAPEAGTKNIVVTWKPGDIINFFFKQGTILFEGTPSTLTQQDISQDGKSATFTITVPAGIDSNDSFTIYALHGAPFIVDTNNNKINVNVSPVGFSLLTELNNIPITGEVIITPPIGTISIDFTHLGVLQCLNLRNTSASDFVITPSLLNASGTDWYHTYSGGTTAPHYDLIGKQVADATVTPSAAENVTIPSGSTVLFAQWVMPTADNTPEIKLGALNGGTTHISNNCKPARGSAMQQGRAYHLYTIWDGSELYFTNNTFTPKSSFQPNPLSYGAEYNVNPAGTDFVAELTDCFVSGYFSWQNAITIFSNITIGGKQYHLPSMEEWRSIVPQDYYWVNYERTNYKYDCSETVTVYGSGFTMMSDFRNKSATKTTYALRYKGTNLVSAWKYEYIGKNTDNCHLKITSRSVYGQTVSITDIENDTFWSTNTENDVVRYFPASGWKYLDSVYHRRSLGNFWSSSLNGDERWYMQFSDSGARSSSSITPDRSFTVRLFATNN